MQMMWTAKNKSKRGALLVRMWLSGGAVQRRWLVGGAGGAVLDFCDEVGRGCGCKMGDARWIVDRHGTNGRIQGDRTERVWVVSGLDCGSV
jgi:hypothetical protein